ncbi:HDOD domain-containing protein [bacterium]|nr:HDOD domain-containing protein [bacterium]
MKYNIEIDEQDLPLISTVASEALDLLQDPEANNQKLEDLICKDPALAARVLRTANSPFYSGRTGVTSISNAIFRLGMRNLRNVIVVAATGEFFNDSDPSVQFLWNHSMATAMASTYLANALSFSQQNEVFIAGLLHDIGKLIIMRQYPDVYGPMIQQSIASGTPMHELEDENFNFFNHMMVGGLVIRKWKLHDSVSEVARFHHDLEEQLPMCVNHEQLLCIVALANHFCNTIVAGTQPGTWAAVMSRPYGKELHLNEKKYNTWYGEIRDQLQNQRIG